MHGGNGQVMMRNNFSWVPNNLHHQLITAPFKHALVVFDDSASASMSCLINTSGELSLPSAESLWLEREAAMSVAF